MKSAGLLPAEPVALARGFAGALHQAAVGAELLHPGVDLGRADDVKLPLRYEACCRISSAPSCWTWLLGRDQPTPVGVSTGGASMSTNSMNSTAGGRCPPNLAWGIRPPRAMLSVGRI